MPKVVGMFAVRTLRSFIIENKGAKAVATPWGDAAQALSHEALVARQLVQGYAKLYRMGTRDTSQTGSSAQFWALEHPFSPGYAERYGIPKVNLENADFIETAVIKEDAAFVTRVAPPAGGNPGGGIEVVVEEGSVEIQGHTSL